MKILFIFILCHGAIASEIDSFNIDIKTLKDASPLLNSEVNHSIQLAIKESMEAYPDTCNKKSLVNILKKKLAREGISHHEHFAMESDLIDKVDRRKSKSIYRNFSFKEMSLVYIYPRAMGKTINLDGHLVGTDKIGHFFAEGFLYYNNYFKKGRELKEALIFAADVHEGFLAARFTGVISYGDLVANFNGYRFWSQIFKDNSDLLNETDTAYIYCKENKWIQNRQFRWDSFVDSGWDESRNCSKLFSQTEVDKVKKHLNKVELAKCHSPATVESLQSRYGEYYKYLINDEGISLYGPNDVHMPKTFWQRVNQSLSWGANTAEWPGIKYILSTIFFNRS